MIKSENLKPVLYSLKERSLKFSQSEVRIIIINASHKLLTHIYLPHFAAEAENNLRIENKKKYKENTTKEQERKREVKRGKSNENF